MVLSESLHIFIVCFYLVACALYYVGAALTSDRLRHVAHAFAFGGFAMHSAELGMLLAADRKMALVAGDFYFSLLSWCLLLIFFLLRWRLKLDFLALAAVPASLGLYLSAFAASGVMVKMPHSLTVLFFGLHIGTLILSMALLVMALGAGVSFLYLDNRIKGKAKLKALGKDMPSLNIFDRVNHLAVAAGFPLYTVGTLSGFIWRWMDPERKFVWDQMNITAIAVWLVFGFLFYQRIISGWRGRKPAVAVIWVCVFMLVPLIHHSFK